MLDRKQEFLRRACEDLGLRVEFDFQPALPSRKIVTAQAWMPDFGSARGTLMFRSYDDYRDVKDELCQAGFGVSAFNDPPSNEEFELASWADMFAEWGWIGNEANEPPWIAVIRKASES